LPTHGAFHGAGIALSVARFATAGLDEGFAAYDQGDHYAAFREFMPLAGAGNASAQLSSAQCMRMGLESLKVMRMQRNGIAKLRLKEFQSRRLTWGDCTELVKASHKIIEKQ
jgi:hypothetical protein